MFSMNKKTARKILIVVLTAITFSMIFSVPALCKVIRTGIKLSSISTEIAGITESAKNSKPGYGWSEDRVSQYNKCQEEREALCNSSDKLVNIIANSNNLIRLLIFAGLVLVIVPQIACSTLVVPYYYKKLKKAIE